MSKLAHRYLMQLADEQDAVANEGVAELIRLAVEELAGDRLPSGCVPVPTDAWRRVWSLVPEGVRNADSGLSGAEIVATWLEGHLDLWRRVKDATGYTFEGDAQVLEAVEQLRKGFGDPYGVAHAMEDLQNGIAVALGVEGDPESHDLVATAREMAATLHSARIMLEEAKGSLERRDEMIADLANERDRYRAAIVGIIGDVSPDDTPEGMGEELRLRFSDLSRDLDAMTQRALMPDATEPTQEAEADRIGEAFEGYRAPKDRVAVTLDREPNPANGGGEPLVSPAIEGPPAVMHSNPPVPDDFPGRDKEPERVSFAPERPRIPKVDDRVEAIRRLAEGESKADIASFLGLKSAVTVHGMTLHDKSRIQRLKQAAPHDKDRVLAEIRRELAAKAVPSA